MLFDITSNSVQYNVHDNVENDDNDDYDGDIYIMMQCLSVCHGK